MLSSILDYLELLTIILSLIILPTIIFIFKQWGTTLKLNILNEARVLNSLTKEDINNIDTKLDRIYSSLKEDNLILSQKQIALKHEINFISTQTSKLNEQMTILNNNTTYLSNLKNIFKTQNKFFEEEITKLKTQIKKTT